MALTNCSECGRSVSSEATACPHCGHPLKKEKGKSAPFVSRPAGCVLQLVAGGLLLWAATDLAEPGNLSGMIVKGLIGLILLYVGGRTKAL